MGHMTTSKKPFADPALQQQLDDFLSDPDARVQRFDHEGEVYWAKKSENLSLKWRLQKGDPAAAFTADREGLQALWAAGVSVPDVVEEGTDFLVMRDGGPILSDLLVAQIGSTEDRIRAMEAAGSELATMHAKGLSHGRPAIKDMCWDGTRLTLLDFERFSPKRNTPKGHMQDLIIWRTAVLPLLKKTYPRLKPDLQPIARRTIPAHGTAQPNGATATVGWTW